MSATAATLPTAASSRRVALGLLLAAYTLSFLDRQIVGVLLEPIKAEFALSDTQLALARIGVGIGEAGSSPPSHSIIADLYSREERSAAMGVLGLGAYIGSALGILVGGLVAQEYGWRAAMFIAGLPGLVLVAVIAFTLQGDRMEMAHSIEGRVPFLDHKVGEFLANTPVNLKIRAQTEKYILREATRDVITDTVYRRQKHPFLSPPESSTERSRMSELVGDTLRSSAVSSIPFLDATAVRGYAAELDGLTSEQRGAVDTDTLLLVSMITLHERFGVASV